MRIRKKFLQLTRKTYPAGTESQLEKYLPKGYEIDEFGNYYIEIGSNPKTMFTCHLDTASINEVNIRHVFDGKYIKTDGKSILGADDKAGMVVLLYMTERKIPGLYYFFLSEEVGCIGSNELSKLFRTTEHGLNRVISFDRKGTTSIITHQLMSRCCSDDFAKELKLRLNSQGLNLDLDVTGVVTDSASFMDFIPECTNISVGYYKEHTTDEHQDIEFLQKLCKAVCNISWEDLPTKRDPQMITSRYVRYGEFDDWYDDWNNDVIPDQSLVYGYCKKKEEYYTHILDAKGNSVKALISESRINYERGLIYNMLKMQGQDVDEIKWDGTDCWISSDNSQMIYLANRSGLIQFIDELSNVPYSDLTIIKNFVL